MKLALGGLFGILGLSVFFMPVSHAQVLGRSYGRSIVINQQGIAATSQVLASQTGAQVLARGGSAVDAAIASNAVLAVTEPMMTGMGGDLFVMYWDAKTGKLTGLNSSGPAPQALSPAFLARHDIKSMPQDGIHSVTVPGAVQGWYQMHQRFGKLPWKDLFRDAIAFGDHGFPVYEGAREVWADRPHSPPEGRSHRGREGPALRWEGRPGRCRPAWRSGPVLCGGGRRSCPGSGPGAT